MRGRRHYISALIVSLILMIGLMAAIKPAKAAYVKVYVDQPAGYIPFETPGANQAVVILIKIETSGIADGTAAGIIAWGLNVQVDPNVLDINLTTPSNGFPPPKPAATAIGAQAGYFLWEFASMMGYGAPTLMAGMSDPTTGLWEDIAESGVPSYATGAGDYVSGLYPKLVTLKVTSKSDTQPCLIDLIGVVYKTADGVVHPVEVVIDGYYGTPPPTYMSETADPFDPTNPIGSMWHELYPNYCKMWDLTSWVDNGDGYLSASDQIDMTTDADPGWIYWWHVDAVTVTIHWTFKSPATGEGDAEPSDVTPESITDPIGTYWHQIYPDYCRYFKITSWEDNGDGEFGPSDQFDFQYEDEPGVTYWAHMDKVTTDIILSFKEKEPEIPEFPLGLEIMMMLAAAIPIVYIWRTRKWSGKK